MMIPICAAAIFISDYEIKIERLDSFLQFTQPLAADDSEYPFDRVLPCRAVHFCRCYDSDMAHLAARLGLVLTIEMNIDTFYLQRFAKSLIIHRPRVPLLSYQIEA
jgi:hypothetical protein